MSDKPFLEKLICYTQKWPIFCPICGQFTKITDINSKNIRESCLCYRCHSTNRQRQMATTICKHLEIPSLNKISKYTGTIYNTESFGPIHEQLYKTKKYIYSEYFGNKYKSGTKHKGTLHQDLMKTSFSNRSLNLVLSSDVFEHIPKPYLAHKEIYRILKPGGTHIFTVPFSPKSFRDEKRASIVKGKTKYWLPPIYHLDGIRPKKGALVYNIFGKEMFFKLEKIGFKVKMQILSKPFLGILGNNAIVFIAQKI